MIVLSPLIEKELGEVNAFISSFFEPELDMMKVIADKLLRSGGKRLRPVLLLLSARLYNGITADAICAASIIEIIHAASLLHDDVVDSSDIRRGMESLNVLMNNKVSVLLGDFLFTKSYARLSRFSDRRVLTAVTDAVAYMSLGQFIEAYYQNDLATTIAEYLSIIKRKTASLFSASCRIGAIIGMAPDEHVERLDCFGLNLGIAYQIIDDCLDLWGDENAMGKPVGSDLAERKYTLPVLHALKEAGHSDRERLMELLTLLEPEGKEIEEILQILNRYEARTFSCNIADEFGRKALEALEVTPSGDTRRALEALVHYSIDRDR